MRRTFVRIASSGAAVLGLAACHATDPVTPAVRATESAPALTQHAPAVHVNLIQNPGLETTNGRTTPVSWSAQYWGTVPRFTYPATGRSGRGATVTQSVNSTGDARWQHSAVPVTAGAGYTFRIWYRSTTPTTLVAAYSNAAGVMTYGQLAAMPSSGNLWIEQASTFTIPSGIVRVTVYVAISRAGSVTIDDASLALVHDAPPPPTPFSEGMVSLTFDDAWESQYFNALPVLEAAGYKGTFYLTTVPIEQRWNLFMTPAAVQEIAAKGHEIAGHTLIHPDLTAIPIDSVRRELIASRNYLQTLTNRMVTSFAYPFGNNTPAIQTEVANAGYSSARTVAYTQQNGTNTNRYGLHSMCVEPANTLDVIKRQIDAAMLNRTWFILCFHDVKVGGDNLSITPTNFQVIVDYLKMRGTRVVTVAQGRALMVP
jgi:peptidoglycan/xylan/chitin deacetylase (PgdA/CDA1 family)